MFPGLSSEIKMIIKMQLPCLEWFIHPTYSGAKNCKNSTTSITFDVYYSFISGNWYSW